MSLNINSTPIPIAVEEFAAHLELLHPSQDLAVAVSGGGDSMALLVLATRWAAGKSTRLSALTVDHGIRPAAKKETQQISQWCRGLGVAHHTLRVDSPAPASNLQMWAREQRYQLLTEWARAVGTTDILLAHTKDDQAETFLLRLARGSGVDGLAGMAPVTTRDNVRLLRPLLDYTRAQLRQTLQARGQEWIEDPSNMDARFDRVRLRQQMPALASLGLTVHRLAKTATTMARARDALSVAANELQMTAVQPGHLGEMIVIPQALHGVEPELALRVLGDALKSVSGGHYRPRLSALQELLTWVVTGAGQSARTLHGCELRRLRNGQVLLLRELAACQPPIRINAGEQAIWDQRWWVRLESGAACTVGALGATSGLPLAQPRTSWVQSHRLVQRTAPAFRCRGEIVAVPTAGTLVLKMDAPRTSAELKHHVAN